MKRFLQQPEAGSVFGALFVFVFFGIFAADSGFISWRGFSNVFEVAAQLGIIAVGAAVLMMAGEFDLSIGSMIGAAGMILALTVSELGWPLWGGVVAALVFAVAVGLANGYLVIKTRLPSFIITLASLFVVRGLCVGFTRLLTGRTQISGIKEVAEGSGWAGAFAGHAGQGLMYWLTDMGLAPAGRDGTPAVLGLPVSVLWWIGLALAAHWLVFRSKAGNWILATGGDVEAARNMGVPVDRVKIACFVLTALCAALLAIIQVIDTGSADTNRGIQKEFEAIIAVVIGGTLLTGGYGSVLGACMGALIFGAVEMGIFFTGVDTDWLKVFLGIMMLIAVLVNDAMRRVVTGGEHH